MHVAGHSAECKVPQIDVMLYRCPSLKKHFNNSDDWTEWEKTFLSNNVSLRKEVLYIYRDMLCIIC